MRKGYTLIELIMATALIALVFLLMSDPLHTMISEFSRQHREFGVAQTMDHLFGRLKTDIEAASELMADTEPNRLIVVDNGEIITWCFNTEQVSRQMGSDPNSTGLWVLPNSRIAWKIRNPGTLQITGYVERTFINKTETRFHNSHLFYVKNLRPGESQ